MFDNLTFVTLFISTNTPLSKLLFVADFTDQEAVQRFFLQEVQLGEELLAQGDIETGVEHLGLAVAVCGQPHSLLGVLQQTLPPQVSSNSNSINNVFTRPFFLLELIFQNVEPI